MHWYEVGSIGRVPGSVVVLITLDTSRFRGSTPRTIPNAPPEATRHIEEVLARAA